MASTRKRDRIFAGFGAFLFLATACGLTIFVILQSTNTSNTNPTAQKTCVAPQNQVSLPVPQIYTTPAPVSSLEITDIEQGSGNSAKNGDCLIMKYYGTVATTGKKFDENFTDTSAFAFRLGQGQVITGWDKGLVGMKVGGVRRLVIPSAQAYGANPPSADIPINADLVFEVKLIKIQT